MKIKEIEFRPHEMDYEIVINGYIVGYLFTYDRGKTFNVSLLINTHTITGTYNSPYFPTLDQAKQKAQELLNELVNGIVEGVEE